MPNISPSDARRLLGLPARGRISRARLQQAHDEALKIWTTALSGAIRGTERQRARDVLGMLPVARAVLKAQPKTGQKMAASVRRKDPSTRSSKPQLHATGLLAAYRAFSNALEGTSAVLKIPKAVVVIIVALTMFIMLQSCAHQVATAFSGPRQGAITRQGVAK